MADTGGLRNGLHPQNGPEVVGRVGVLSMRRVLAKNQKVVAQQTDQRPGGKLWSQTVHLDERFLAISLVNFGEGLRLPHYSRQGQPTIHDESANRNAFESVSINSGEKIQGLTGEAVLVDWGTSHVFVSASAEVSVATLSHVCPHSCQTQEPR